MYPHQWTLESALPVVKLVESIAPDYGCHVALTGGILYKEGFRKDLDLLFYRIRQVNKIDEEGLLNRLSNCGFTILQTHGWVTKARLFEKDVDLFFPERLATAGYPTVETIEAPR